MEHGVELDQRPNRVDDCQWVGLQLTRDFCFSLLVVEDLPVRLVVANDILDMGEPRDGLQYDADALLRLVDDFDDF